MLSDEMIEWALRNPPTKEQGVNHPVADALPVGLFPEVDPIIPVAGFIMSAYIAVVTRNPEMAARMSYMMTMSLPELSVMERAEPCNARLLREL